MRSICARNAVFSAAFLSLALVAGLSRSAGAEEAGSDEALVTAALVLEDVAAKQASESGLQLASDVAPVMRDKNRVRPKAAPRRDIVRHVAQRIEPRPIYYPIVLYLGVAF